MILKHFIDALIYSGLGGSPSGHSDSSTRISTPAETKFGMGGSVGGISSDVDMKSGGGNGGGANPRSPLSLAHHHHAAAAAFDYGRAMMGSHAAVTAGLGVGSSVGTSVAANSTNTNGELNGSGGLRISTNENGLNNDQQLLSPVHDQQQAAAVAHQQAVAAAVAAQHHQHPHQQQQQQVAQQGMSENVRALFCLYFVLLFVSVFNSFSISPVNFNITIINTSCNEQLTIVVLILVCSKDVMFIF